MISSEALHLGPLMLPWTLIIILIGLMTVSIIGQMVSNKLRWDKAVIQVFRDSLWISVLIGLIGARIVFVLLHWDAYSTSPLDIFKIQDKGFHLIGGIVTAIPYFLWKNKGLPGKSKAIFIFIFTLLLSLGIAFQNNLKQETHFPDSSFSSLIQHGEISENVPLKQLSLIHI